MKKIIKRLANVAMKLFLILLALNSLQIYAQKSIPEFSINAAGGLATNCFQPSVKGVFSLGYSSDIGFGFAGFFNQQAGIATGVGFGMFNVKSIANVKTISSDLYEMDDQGKNNPYELHTTLSKYAEIHKTLFVNIPVMFQFQTRQPHYWNWRRNQKAGFYIMGGVKVLFLFNNKYAARVDSLFNAAYFPELDNWAKTQRFAGFGNFKIANEADGKLDFGVMAMFAFETGVKWRIDNNLFLYTGAFFDCALNDPIKDGRQPSENFIMPEQLSNLSIVRFSKRVNIMVVGVKLRFAFTRPQRPY
jgi:hypothetical protein